MTDHFKTKKGFLFRIAETRKKQICFLIFALLSIAVMVSIFLFSSQTAENSAALSGEIKGLLDKILKNYEWLISESGILWIKTYIRKIAHFVLYSLLGAFLSAAIFNTRIKSILLRLSVSAGIAFFYSITDEIHQLFVDGRSGEVRDVLLDFSGALSGIIIVFLIYKTIQIITKKCKKA